MQFDFNIGKSTVAQIVKDTCQICWKVLQPTEMSPPTTEIYQNNFIKIRTFLIVSVVSTENK